MMVWLPPYRAEIETWGPGFGDFAKGPGCSYLVSERFKKLIDKHRITGFAGFESVEITRVRRHARFRGDPPPYYHVTVERDTAVMDEVRSECEHDGGPVCPECRIVRVRFISYRRIILEEGTWSGRDIFEPRGFSPMLVTERFKNLWVEAGMRGLVFIPADSEEGGDDGYVWNNVKRIQEIMNMPVSEKLWKKTLRDGRVLRYYKPLNQLVYQYPDGRLVMGHPFSDFSWDDLK